MSDYNAGRIAGAMLAQGMFARKNLFAAILPVQLRSDVSLGNVAGEELYWVADHLAHFAQFNCPPIITAFFPTPDRPYMTDDANPVPDAMYVHEFEQHGYGGGNYTGRQGHQHPQSSADISSAPPVRKYPQMRNTIGHPYWVYTTGLTQMAFVQYIDGTGGNQYCFYLNYKPVPEDNSTRFAYLGHADSPNGAGGGNHRFYYRKNDEGTGGTTVPVTPGGPPANYRTGGSIGYRGEVRGYSYLDGGTADEVELDLMDSWQFDPEHRDRSVEVSYFPMFRDGTTTRNANIHDNFYGTVFGRKPVTLAELKLLASNAVPPHLDQFPERVAVASEPFSHEQLTALIFDISNGYDPQSETIGQIRSRYSHILPVDVGTAHAWKMEEAQGSDRVDVGGGGEDLVETTGDWGQVAGAVSAYAAKKITPGSSLRSAGAGAVAPGDNPFTVSFWLKLPEENAGLECLLAEGPDEANNTYRFSYNGTLNGGMVGFNTALGGGNTTVSNTPLGDNEWHHILGRRGDDGRWSLWVDGKGKFGPVADVAGTQGIMCVGEQGNAARPVTVEMEIDELYVYTRALSDREIARLARGEYVHA